MEQEFIVGLVNHRRIGRLFQPFIIENNGDYYSITRLVKARDLETLELTAEQAALVKVLGKISDEELTRRFSREKGAHNFINELDEEFFNKHVSPFIDLQMTATIRLLMQGNIRLFEKQDKYSNLYEEDIIKVNKNFVSCRMLFEKNNEGIHYKLQLQINNENFPLLYKKPVFISMSPAAFVYKGVLYAFEKLNSKRIIPFLSKHHIQVTSSAELSYLNGFVRANISEYRVKLIGMQLEIANPKPLVKINIEENLLGNQVFIPKFDYEGKQYGLNDKETSEVVLDDSNGYHFKKINRDVNFEKQVIEHLQSLGLKEHNGAYFPSGTELMTKEDANQTLANWMAKHGEDLNQLNVEYERAEEVQIYSKHKADLKWEIEESGDWFDLFGYVWFGEYKFPFIRFKKMILAGVREFVLPNGELAILPSEWFADYKEILSHSKDVGDCLRLRKTHFSLLKNGLRGIDKRYLERFNKLEHIDESIASPSGLNAELREYQHKGYAWLLSLKENGFGACLADDMGLGKTLQTIALLLKNKREKLQMSFSTPGDSASLFDELEEVNASITHKQGASLIVMPTSLIYNWQNELRKFAPELKVCTHYGMQRRKNTSFKNLSNLYDVILTTYGTIRNDIDIMAQTEFFYIVLDESQNIKNPESKIYKAVTQLKSEHKLVLTGTPIENSLSDLWAQMNFVNQGLLGSYTYFKREFIQTIEKQNNEEKKEKLKTIIRPFILRRSKMEVAKDLPPVTQQIMYCDMDANQAKIYEKEKSIVRKELLENIENDGVAKSSIVILQALSRLRQLANHPRLIDNKQANTSGKFNEITEKLSSLINDKHKVLIFSSFVKHLNLVSEYLEENEYSYSMLTGQTTNREQVIKRFQDDDNTNVFLISLKAGGVGLNLTEADYVFILDPWWNPAAEMQAISRAHRIGQDKNVMVYRFITKESIEEKMIKLQEEKMNLAEQFVNSNNPFQGISKEEVVHLFS